MSAVPLVLLTLAAGCKPTAVSGVQLTPPAAALAAGEKTAIQVVIEPENAAVQTVTWSVEPERIVALNDIGEGMCTVTADTEGTAIITAATADDGKTAQCQIIVCHTIDNTDFIKAVGGQCCWNLTGSGTVLLTPENLERIQAVTELYISGEGDRTLCDLSGIE